MRNYANNTAGVCAQVGANKTATHLCSSACAGDQDSQEEKGRREGEGLRAGGKASQWHTSDTQTCSQLPRLSLALMREL